MKKILITGANSYIGSSFEKYIKEKYPKDYVVDSVSVRSDSWKEKSFSGYDCVFHVAGIAHIQETKQNAALYYRINRDLAVAVAQKAKEEGVKQFIFVSSMSIYGLNKGVITRDTKPNPKSNYGKSKRQAEIEIQALEDEKFCVAILRPPMVYGKECKGNYQVLRKLAWRLPLFPYIKNRRSMIFIDNLSEFVRLAIEHVSGGFFCPQNEEYVNTSAMVREIGQAQGKKIRLIKGFGWLIRFMGLFIDKICKAFGNLVYDKRLSAFEYEYIVADFEKSIYETERNELGK